MSTPATEMDQALPKLSAGRLRTLNRDHERSAAAIQLRYVSDRMPGIQRIAHGSTFRYRYHNKPLKDEGTLARIRSLAIPPAWKDVWICPYENGHLQATGKDARGRKQYRYHAKWSAVRSRTKFHHTIEFGERLPMIRERLAKDLARPGLSREKVLALVLSILDDTPMRVGNPAYEKVNNSYGLSTLKDRHVKKGTGTVRLVFKGKTGIAHNVWIRSRKLSRLVMRCRDLPGQELFQYIGEDGQPRPIDSGMVNDHIREIAQGDFSSKDFRTWKGTVQCLRILIAEECPAGSGARKEMINKALDEAAKLLGNTRAICRKYYVHPHIINSYECQKLHRSLKRDRRPERTRHNGLTFEEQLVLKVLIAERRS